MKFPFHRLLQAKEELEDIESILGFTPDNRRHPLGTGSCSAFIKLLTNNSDLFVAHSTWSVYNEMLRVIKKYNLAYNLSPSSESFIFFYRFNICVT